MFSGVHDSFDSEYPQNRGLNKMNATSGSIRGSQMNMTAQVMALN
jgi:hypothetical protein